MKAALGVNPNATLELFAIGSDAGMMHAWQTAPGGGWSSWASLAGGGTRGRSRCRHQP